MIQRIDDIWSDSTILQIQTVADNLVIQFKRYNESNITIKFHPLIGIQIKPNWRNPEQVEAVLISNVSNNFSDLVVDLLKGSEEPIDDLKIYQIIDIDQNILIEIIARECAVIS